VYVACARNRLRNNHLRKGNYGMKIFISSTYEDLKNERKEAIATVDRIGQAIAMEKFFASNYLPKEVCLGRLQECDAVVLILGFKYGSIDKVEGLSLTEIEYNTAKVVGLPVFVLQKRQSDGNWESGETDSDRSKKLLSFKSRLDAEKYRITFQTPEQIGKEILGAFYRYKDENGEIGIRLPPFVSYEDFFRPFFDNAKLFNHSYPLVGRNDYLEKLDSFVESGKRIALLYGRGGIGKSKILVEFSFKFEEKHRDWKLWFLREGVILSTDAIRQLPAQKSVIVVDDAHRREDLSILFAIAQQYSNRIKIVLSSRPQGIDHIRASLTEGGFDPREVENISEVVELARPDLEELGKKVLGKDHGQFLESLIQVAKDSPLVVIIGGRLVKEHAIDPKMLERHDEFNRAVFDRFQDVLTGQVSDRIGAELCRNILSFVSAVSPIQPQTAAFQEHASKFLGIELAKLIDAIGILESSGILLRRGYSLRITPDVLSDNILYNACVTFQGQSTSYAHKVFYAFGSVFPENVLYNLSELDWRVTREGKSVDLLGEIWTVIYTRFKLASHVQRLQISEYLKRTSYFQPARTLALVEYAIHNPSKAQSNEKRTFGHLFSHRDVLQALPSLLRGIAFNLDYLSRCCDLLWLLGKNDERPTGPNPEHAMRVLFDLAEYDLGKPIQVNYEVLNAIERWLHEANAHENINSPLDVLDYLLKKEGFSTNSRGYSFVFRPFAVSFETTRPIREKAILLLSECTKSQSGKVVLRGLKSLIAGLQPPHGLFGRAVSDDEINRWLPEQMMILEVIEDLAKSGEPIVQIQIASDLQWFAKRSNQREIAEKAASITGVIPDSFDLRIARVIWNKYDHYWETEDYNQRQKRIEQKTKETVYEFLGRFDNGEVIFDFLNGILNHFQDCGIQAQPGYFLYFLSTNNYELASQICERIIKFPSLLSTYLHTLLSGIREKRPSRAIELTTLAVETNSVTLCASVAYGYSLGGWASSIEDEEIHVIESLVGHSDKNVKYRAIEVLGRFPSAKREKAIQLALSINIDDENQADALCGIFDSKYGIPFDQIEDRDLTTFLSKLIKIKTIDTNLYHLYKFLGYCSSRIPETIVDFLLKRLDIAKEKDATLGDRYQPLPYLGFHDGLKSIASSPNYRDILRKVRDHALNPNAVDYFWIPKLFSEISNGFCSVCLEVLYEWIESNDDKKIQAIGLLVKDAPSDFVFSHSEFVSRLLEKSYTKNDDCYRSVCGSLFSSALSRAKTGTAGQPMPQDVQLRDQAKELSKRFLIGSPTQRFYLELVNHAEASIRDSLMRDEEVLEER